MGLMLSKTYAALKAAGASERQAQEAAEEIASFEQRLIRLETTMKLNLAATTAVLVGVLSLVIKSLFE